MKEYWLEFKFLDREGKENQRGVRISELIELSLRPADETQKVSQIGRYET